MLPTAEHVRQVRELAHAARVYLDSEPWAQIREPDCFALRDPWTGEQVFLSVRGAADPAPGLALFRGSEGFDSMHWLRNRPLDSLDELEMLDISGTFVEFRPMCSLPAHDLRPLEVSGETFERDGLAPTFFSYLPGYVPGGPTVEEIRLLTLGMQESCEVAMAVAIEDLRLEPVDERWIERRLLRNGDRWWWEHTRARAECRWPPCPLEPQAIDELTAARLARLPLMGGEIWEVDLVPLTMVRKLSPEERWPILLALVIADRWTGMPRHLEQVPAPGRHASLGPRLARALLELGARPAQLRVRDHRMRAGLAGAARAIGAKLITVRQLPAVDVAHEALRGLRELWPDDRAE